MRNFLDLYIHGFKNLGTLGIKLWLVIIIKLIIMFVILKPFFFPKFLQTRFHTQESTGSYVIDRLKNNINLDKQTSQNK